MKIGVVGAGRVGAATISALIRTPGIAPEIVVVDRDEKKAAGLATDLGYAAALDTMATVVSGGYDALLGAELVIVTAGVNEKAGGATDRGDPRGRRVLIPANAKAYADIIPAVARVAPETSLLVVTDPPDPLADLAIQLAPRARVLSTGTVIDSLRFRVEIARRLNVRPADVDAYVLGEHGTSGVFAWSTARVGGMPALELLADAGERLETIRSEIEKTVAYGNITIIEGIGASQYGIGAVVARIARAILCDERAVLPVASHHDEFDVTLALPSIVGANGVLATITPPLTPEEQAALARSAEVLRDAKATALEVLAGG